MKCRFTFSSSKLDDDQKTYIAIYRPSNWHQIDINNALTKLNSRFKDLDHRRLLKDYPGFEKLDDALDHIKKKLSLVCYRKGDGYILQFNQPRDVTLEKLREGKADEIFECAYDIRMLMPEMMRNIEQSERPDQLVFTIDASSKNQLIK